MIFAGVTDIEIDIHERLSNYLANNLDVDTQNLLSLLRSYLHELKSIGEINHYIAEIDSNLTDNIAVHIRKDLESKYFIINVNLEIRKLKINKITSQDNRLKTFLE